MPTRLLLVLLVLATLLALVWPSPAGAGTYDVYSCRLPDGTSIPAVSGSRRPRSGTCSPPNTTEGAEVGWVFNAPADTTVQASLDYFSAFDRWPLAPGNDAAAETCVPEQNQPLCIVGTSSGWAATPTNVYERMGLRLAGLLLGIRCPVGGTCATGGFPGGERQLRIYASRLTLNDEQSPRFKHDPAVNASANAVELSLADRGSGISGAQMLIDGNVAGKFVASDVNASCGQPFTDPVPCPLEQELSMPLDSGELLDGDHELRAQVTDATGDATWSRPVTIRTRSGRLVVEPSADPEVIPAVEGAPEVPATPATGLVRLRAWFSGKSRAVQRTLRFGERAAVEGVLTDSAGAPVANVPLRVTERAIGVTSAARPGKAVRTDAKGRFSYTPVAGPSRVVEVSYGAAVARVTVRVRAGVTLKTSRKLVRNGTALKFSGRVLGERGTRRALVTIYALTGGTRPRVPVETVRAGSDGRFSYTWGQKVACGELS